MLSVVCIIISLLIVVDDSISSSLSTSSTILDSSTEIDYFVLRKFNQILDIRNSKKQRIFSSIRGGDSFDQISNFRSEFVFGKDRELFHASLDFKWLYSILTDRNTWNAIIRNIVERWHKLDGSYKVKNLYKDQAIDILLKIRENNENCSLRFTYYICSRLKIKS